MFDRRTVARYLLQTCSIIGGAILISGICVFFVSAGIGKTADEVVVHKNLRATLDRRNSTIAEISKDAEKIQEADTRIRAAFLPSSNILEFVGALESMATKNNIVQSPRFDTPIQREEMLGDPSRHLNEVGFTLSIQANLPTFLQYLKDLEHLPYFFRISDISITSPANGGWSNVSNISIRGTLFTLGDD